MDKVTACQSHIDGQLSNIIQNRKSEIKAAIEPIRKAKLAADSIQM
jgi:hypothetical protein